MYIVLSLIFNNIFIFFYDDLHENNFYHDYIEQRIRTYLLTFVIFRSYEEKSEEKVS